MLQGFGKRRTQWHEIKSSENSVLTRIGQLLLLSIEGAVNTVLAQVTNSITNVHLKVQSQKCKVNVTGSPCLVLA